MNFHKKELRIINHCILYPDFVVPCWYLTGVVLPIIVSLLLLTCREGIHVLRQLEAVQLLEADIRVVVPFPFMPLTRPVRREPQMVLPMASVRILQTTILRNSEVMRSIGFVVLCSWCFPYFL